MDNPFQPKQVKLFNYHPEEINQRKLQNITSNMNQVKQNGYQNCYHEKRYGDAMNRPLSYSDVLQKPDHYSDHLPQQKGYSDGFRNN